LRKNLKTFFAPGRIDYDGSQLSSNWISNQFGLVGDSLVAFRGACDVKAEHMVDLEDLQAGAKIFSQNMVHFIGEFFDPDLEKGVLRQRLLICVIKEKLEEKGVNLLRQGDDLYLGGGNPRKLSVSVATVSPVSVLIHVGLNVISEGAPVPAVGLDELGVDPEELARQVMEAYLREEESMRQAQAKVKAVK